MDNKPQEPLIIRFISVASGNVDDELTVDHMADVLLLFYAAVETAIGAVVGGTVGTFFVRQPVDLLSIMIVPAVGFIGAITGATVVLSLLSFRGLLRWDRYELKRTYRPKPNAVPLSELQVHHSHDSDLILMSIARQASK